MTNHQLLHRVRRHVGRAILPRRPRLALSAETIVAAIDRGGFEEVKSAIASPSRAEDGRSTSSRNG